MRTRLGHFIRQRDGASAAEFALVAPLFIALVFGVIHMSFLVYAAATLHYATEAAARCYAVNATACPDAGSAQTYATDHYTGPGIGPTFTATKNGACHSTAGASDGHKVTASGTYPIRTGLLNFDVPLSASACFP